MPQYLVYCPSEYCPDAHAYSIDKKKEDDATKQRDTRDSVERRVRVRVSKYTIIYSEKRATTKSRFTYFPTI